MILNTEAIADFERAQAVAEKRSYHEALAVFAALWREAAALRDDFPGDWREDIAPDIAVARALNGPPPA